jgi:hypothetical protein
MMFKPFCLASWKAREHAIRKIDVGGIRVSIMQCLLVSMRRKARNSL